MQVYDHKAVKLMVVTISAVGCIQSKLLYISIACWCFQVAHIQSLYDCVKWRKIQNALHIQSLSERQAAHNNNNDNNTHHPHPLQFNICLRRIIENKRVLSPALSAYCISWTNINVCSRVFSKRQRHKWSVRSSAHFHAAVSDSSPDLTITGIQSRFPQSFCSAGLLFSSTCWNRCQKNKRSGVYSRLEREKNLIQVSLSSLNLNLIFLSTSSFSTAIPVNNTMLWPWGT